MSFKVSEKEPKQESKIGLIATIFGTLVGVIIISQRFGAFAYKARLFCLR